MVSDTVEREKTKSSANPENQIKNIVYVYADHESNDSWQKVQDFAKENPTLGSKAYIMKTSEEIKRILKNCGKIENSPEKLVIVGQKLTKEGIKHLQQMQEKFVGDIEGILFSVLIKNTPINLLMIDIKLQNGSSNDSTLKKQLAEIIERETAFLICNFLKEQSNENECLVQLNQETNQQKNQEIKQDKNVAEAIPPTVFPSQEKIADGIFQMILNKLEMDSDSSLKRKFKDFRFLVLLPKFVSLEKQTKDRIKREDCLTKNDADSVVRICRGKEMEDKWKFFLEEAKTNQDVFYLIIHDECHWAAGKNQQPYKFLGFEKGDYHFHEGNLLPNLFTLMVSATPYNFFTIDSIQEHILNWTSCLEQNKISNEYNGITALRNNQKIQPGIDIKTSKNTDWKQNMYDHFSPAIFNGFSAEFICAILDYYTALYVHSNQNGHHCTNPASEIVHQSIQKCIKENKLIVVRLESAFDDIRQSEVAKQVIEEAITKKKLQLEVIVDNSSKDFDVGSQLNNESFKMTVLQNVKHRTGNSSSNNIQIADLKGVPAIVFIIEKCRMGDTFPSSCVCFDLRSRYLQPVKDFTSIIQDVGRAFGYGERPYLLLSPEADDFLTKIWNNESEGISWENLQSQLPNVHLGKNMERRSEPMMKAKNSCTVEPALECQTFDVDIDFNFDFDFFNLLEYGDESKFEWNKLENESERPEEIVSLFQDIYQADPKQPVFLYNLKLTEETFRHRIILKAEPQIGKTGSFIHLIKKFCQLLRSNNNPTRNKLLPLPASVLTDQNEGGLLHFTKSFYKKMSTEEIKKDFATETGKKKYRDYMKGVKYARNKRKDDGILEPSKWAALCLIDDLQKNFKHLDQVQIADFGCGDMKFTEHLLEEINKNGHPNIGC